MSEARNAGDGHLAIKNKEAPSASCKRRIFTPDILEQPCDQSNVVASSTAVLSGAVNSGQIHHSNLSHVYPVDDAGSRDWHVEILTGLFLRSSEQELNRLEEELEGSQSQQHTQFAEIDKIIDKDENALEERASPSEDVSILPLIPSALRGINSEMQPVKKRGRDKFDRPLLIPKCWKRPSYQSLSSSDLKNIGVDTAGKNGDCRLVQTGSLHPKRLKASSSEIEEQSKVYNMMPIFYNECSLSALANWAMMDPPDSMEASAEVTPMQSPPRSQEKWEAYTKELAEKITTNRVSYDVPMVGCTYRKCGVCEKFGHYEVECELLNDRDDDIKPCEHDVDGEVEKPSQRSLDESTRRSAISMVADKIKTQRRLQSVRDSQNKHDESIAETLHENNDYIGTSITCNVCKSGLASHQLLMCDGCDELFHLSCLDPPLDVIPEGDWLCDRCIHYDSDDSVVDIEGCGEFVIEQRKRSMAESCEQFAGISLGYHKCRWTVASSIVEQSEPILDRQYLNDHLADGHDGPNFIPGKLCWVRESNEQFDHPDWWPAMIIQIEKDSTTVRFFGIDKTENISSSSILPYLPYYEDIIYKQLDLDCSMNKPFRIALELSLSALGLKTFGQALKLSRSVIQKSIETRMDGKSTNATGRLRSSGWIPPIGWERADVENIDGYVILSKEKRQSQRMSQNSPSNGTDDALASSHPNSSKQDNNFSDFFLDEVIGGMVSWPSEKNNGSTFCDEYPTTQFGIVLSINPATEMALVRVIQLDEDLLNYDRQSIGNEVQIQNLGSTIWMPLCMLGFISSKPSSSDLIDFRSTLRSRMNKEMKLDTSRSKAAAVAREENTVELSFDMKE